MSTEEDLFIALINVWDSLKENHFHHANFVENQLTGEEEKLNFVLKYVGRLVSLTIILGEVIPMIDRVTDLYFFQKGKVVKKEIIDVNIDILWKNILGEDSIIRRLFII